MKDNVVVVVQPSQLSAATAITSNAEGLLYKILFNYAI
jgi:hypothetical protein